MARHTAKNLIDVEDITIASVASFQVAGINGAKLGAAETDGLMANGYAPLNQKSFNVAMAVTTRLRLKR